MVKLENRNINNIVETHAHTLHTPPPHKHICKNNIKRGCEFIKGERGIHEGVEGEMGRKNNKKLYYYLKTKNK